MKEVTNITLNTHSREEFLPDFAPDFPYIATRAQLDRYPSPVVPWHWHRTAELFYVESGCLEYTTPHGQRVFPAGSGGFVNPHVLHTTRIIPTNEATVQLLHLFDPVLLSGTSGSRIETRYILPLTSSGTEMISLSSDVPAQAKLLQQIRQAFSLPQQEQGYEVFLRETLCRIWLQLLPMADTSMNCRSNDEPIKALMAYVHQHFSQTIRIEQLASTGHMSKRSCFRLFQQHLHMSPNEYLQSVRLQQACRLLRDTNRSVTEIACECGFSSSSYFSRVFQHKLGCSPVQFRKQWHDRTI